MHRVPFHDVSNTYIFDQWWMKDEKKKLSHLIPNQEARLIIISQTNTSFKI